MLKKLKKKKICAIIFIKQKSFLLCDFFFKKNCVLGTILSDFFYLFLGILHFGCILFQNKKGERTFDFRSKTNMIKKKFYRKKFDKSP